MTDAPIVVSQLGRPREVHAREVARRPLTVTAAGLIAALALVEVTAAPMVGNRPDLAALVVQAIFVASFGVAGASAAVRRPSERQGPLVVAGSFVGGSAVLLDALITAHTHGAHVDPTLLALARVVVPLSLGLLPMVVMHLLLGLPDGSCRLSRTAIVGGYLIGGAVGLAVWSRRPALPLWPFAIELAGAIAIGAYGSHRRYARSTGPERRRLQWFGWAATVGIETLLVAVALRLLWGWPTRAPLVAAIACLPVALAVALCSSRLAGRIDRMLAHTVSLVGLTGVVVAVYLVVVVGLGRTPDPFRPFVGRTVHGRRRGVGAPLRAGSQTTGSVRQPRRIRRAQGARRRAAGVRQPSLAGRADGRAPHAGGRVVAQDARARGRRSVDRGPGTSRAGGVGARRAAGADGPQPAGPDGRGPRRSAGTAWAEVWLPKLMAGREGSIVRVAPTTHSGHLLGLIVAVRDAGADQFTGDDDVMLTELARQVGLALHNVQLDSALQESIDEVRRQAEELQASRARIVAASDAARRQIERNLHDGAQQHLVALAVNVRLARRLAETDPAASIEILDDLGQGLRTRCRSCDPSPTASTRPCWSTGASGRRCRPRPVGRRYRPRSRRPTCAGSPRRKRRPSTSAAWRPCRTPASTPATGATVRIRVWAEPGALSFEVADDGAGFDTTVSGGGAGFVNMGDRVGAIGGSLVVRSAPGSGTTVSGRIPLSA